LTLEESTKVTLTQQTQPRKRLTVFFFQRFLRKEMNKVRKIFLCIFVASCNCHLIMQINFIVSLLAFGVWGLLLSLQPAFYPTEAESKVKTVKFCSNDGVSLGRQAFSIWSCLRNRVFGCIYFRPIHCKSRRKI